MRGTIFLFSSMVVLLMPPASIGSGSDRDVPQSAEVATDAGQERTRFFTYRPPLGTAKPVRVVGAGARAPIDGDLMISVLSPEHVAYTTKAQPTLYWFASRPIRHPIEVVIIEVVIASQDRIEPVFRKRLDGAAAGINQISLERLGVRLDPNKEYEWSVEVVIDPKQHSRSPVTKTRLQRIVASGGLAAQLQSAALEEQPAIYAENGIWYDSLEAVSRLIAAQPHNPLWQQQRAALLEQGELPAQVVEAARGG